MSIRCIIQGAKNRIGALVTSTGFLCVQPATEPVFSSRSQTVIPFRQFLTDDGLSSGSEDMIVDGSSTAIEFWIPASSENDRYITILSVVIADVGNFAQNEFGNLGSALTNGCRLFYERGTGEEIDIHNSLKTNFDFNRLALGRPAFGSTGDTFRGTNFIGTAEATMPIIDFKEFIPPYGIKLDHGTTQRLVLSIRDALAGLTTFDIIAYGFDRLPD